ncbi:signal peptidase II [Pseudaminobacter sp. 19-2017]|uniref:Lipoprotein signal peptidase n=2 Tax=Pseudaminobacter soli (ex Zhang et al. 2022) TaxID=2831468 RepID=A0A942E665_9HYPH|nr:signal peptidase II [Pseudaminobacter soli]MBS3651848.1 signal peptidase II [Pseudaminobacter soli]
MKRYRNVSRGLLGLACVVSSFLIDQLSKFAIVEIISRSEKDIYVTSFLNITLSYNRGISFGLLSSHFEDSSLVLSVITSGITCILLIWMPYAKDRTDAMAFGLMAGGASGNIYDRMQQGAVTDFIDLHLGTWHWPTFNTADIAIVTGAVFLAISSLRSAPIASTK